MGFLSFIVTWFESITGNFGVAVVLTILFFFALTVPFRLWSNKNKLAKKKCEPVLADIRKRYNANQMGVSGEDTPDMPESIKRMNKDERSEAMAKEISAVYKENGYHMWVSAIPIIFNLALVILAYSAIREASPEGFWRLNLSAIRSAGSYAENATYFWIIGAMLISSLLQPVIFGLIDCIKLKKAGKPIKGSVIGYLISAALTVGIAIWIATSIMTSIALAITTFYILTFVLALVEKLRHKDDTSNDSAING